VCAGEGVLGERVVCVRVCMNGCAKKCAVEGVLKECVRKKELGCEE
jgi:hypothetical protein